MTTDLRFAFRTVLRNPAFASIAILTLALGIGVNTAVFSLVHTVFLAPLPFPDAERLVIVSERRGGSRDANIPVSGHEFIAWREGNKVLERVALHRPDRVSVTGSGEPELADVWHVSTDFFRVLRMEPQIGRVFAPGEDGDGREPLVVLSDGMWRRRFGGDPAVSGRRLTIDGTGFTIIGVMAPLPPSLSPDAWLPLDLPAHVRAVGRHNLSVLARLAPGVSLVAAQSDLAAVSARLASERPTDNTDHHVHVSSLRDSLVGEFRSAFSALAMAVGFVLLIACANVASLLLARGTRREAELALRAALGAGRLQLARGLLLESLLLAAIGGALGLLLAAWITDLVASISAVRIPLLETARVDWRALCAAGALSAATGLSAGLIPALRRPASAAEALRSGSQPSADRGGRRLRAALVASEVALTLMLLIGAALMINSFARLVRIDPGFTGDRLLVASLDLPAPKYPNAATRRAFYDAFLAALRALPGVEAAGASSHLPLGGADNWMPFAVEGRPAPSPGQEFYAAVRTATPDYFRTLGIPVRRGRPFVEGDARLSVPVVRWFPQQPEPAGADRPQPQPVVVISEAAAARFWPGEDPIGQRIRMLFSAPMTVVGVVGDVRHNALNAPVSPHIYLAQNQEPWSSMSVVVRTTGAPRHAAPAMRALLQSLDPDLPAAIRTMDDVIDAALGRPRLYAVLIAAFGGLALVLALVGIAGMVSYAAAQRTREIGVRMALGASRREILALVVSQGMRPVLFGIGAGIAGAFIVTRFLETMLYEVRPSDPLTFVAVVTLVGAAAVVACWLPARRAARADPLVALRAE